MNQRRLIFLATLSVCLATATAARAQENSSGPPVVSEQTSQSPSQIASATPSQPAAKKVWTNDDMNNLRENPAISSGLTSNGEPLKTTNKPTAATKNNKDAKSYHDQIARLQAQIPPIDSQIAELQAAIDGKPTGDAKESARPRNVKIDDWSVERDQLQQKRDDIQTHIDALKDQARHNGVPPSALP